MCATSLLTSHIHIFTYTICYPLRPSRDMQCRDPQWFKQIRSTDIGDNWVLKFNNLKKLHRLIVRYYEEVLGYPTVRLEAPNLNAIAKESDHMELLKLCNLVLTLAVQCEKNEKYIGMIMRLDESDQRALMVAIEGVMQHLGNTGESNIESINVEYVSRASGTIRAWELCARGATVAADRVHLWAVAELNHLL